MVDIGVHQDGLVHISELSNRYVKDPGEVVKAGQIVKVRVLSVDIKSRRIASLDEDRRNPGIGPGAFRPRQSGRQAAVQTATKSCRPVRSMPPVLSIEDKLAALSTR